MPFYTYKDKNTDVSIEVIRDMSDYDNPPTVEEAVEGAGMTPEQYQNADWERVIGSGIKVTFAQYSLKGRM